MQAHITGTKTLCKGRFIRLDLMEYETAGGEKCTWEAAQRNGENSAALIIATLKPSGRVLLIRQFRPPLQSYSLEFPAGLVDPGESCTTTAERELLEETGYTGKVVWETGVAASSPGITGEMVSMVFMEIDEELPENKLHKQELQDHEEIEVFSVPISQLSEVISSALKRGDKVCSRLALWAAAQGARW